MWPDKGHNPIMALEPEQKWAKKKKRGGSKKNTEARTRSKELGR